MSSKKDGDPENSVKNEKKKKGIIPKIFGSKRSGKGGSDDEGGLNSDGDGTYMELEKRVASKKNAFFEPYPFVRKSVSEREATLGTKGLNLSNFDQPMTPANEIRELRVFVATWNVGGKTPHNDLNLEDFLFSEGSADLYICGFQEIVPLNAGNVLVIEDNEPTAKWLSLINEALNKRHLDSSDSDSVSKPLKKWNNSSLKESKSMSSHNFFQKPSLKVPRRNFRVNSSLLKTCNCPVTDHQLVGDQRRRRKLSDPMEDYDLERKSLQQVCEENKAVHHLFTFNDLPLSDLGQSPKVYRLIASKQMVGIFLSVWSQKELVPQIAHLSLSSVRTGIMRRLGNKGCISISMSVHETSFCFVCSHLASGEKEGDEIRRNEDVAEILKKSQFSRISKNSNCRAPERITDHDRIFWLGDLNYRVSLSYEETKVFLEVDDWKTLLLKDQLNIEREGGRVFSGFHEGQILFAPTYKYSQNSDSYAGETAKSKKKRRTPAWCDRILWRGVGIEQLSYICGESKFSDHRPVCATFAVEVETRNKPRKTRYRKGYSCTADRLTYEEYCIPQRHSFYI